MSGIALAALMLSSVSIDASNSSVGSLKCRTVHNYKGHFCAVDDFEAFSCLTCYKFIASQVVPVEKRFIMCNDNLSNKTCKEVKMCRQVLNGTKVVGTEFLPPEDYNHKDPKSKIYKTFESDTHRMLWTKCCENAVKCCNNMISEPPLNLTALNYTEKKVCPRTWDGWQCFRDTLAGQTFEAPCPIYAYLRSEAPPCPVTFNRPCEPAGHWSFHPGTRLEWTNYNACYATDFIMKRHYVHIAAYAMSLLALAPAIIIFFIYKQLRIPRITMHKNLFISLFINGIVFIIFKRILIMSPLETPGLLHLNTDGCKFLYVLTKYLRTSNYMWMFCESFYLHKLIVAAFAEQKRLLPYYLIGWGFPIIPILVYSVLRATNPNVDKDCWLPMSPYEWVVNGPNLISLLINFVFLVNIIRVLLSKLRTNTNEPSQYRKAVRATFVLVPLFGLHFILTIMKPTVGPCELREIYYYVNYLMDGLQGFLVAIIFCYCNGEVQNLVKRSYKRWLLRRDPKTLNNRHSINTQVFSVSDSPPLRKSIQIEMKETVAQMNGLHK